MRRLTFFSCLLVLFLALACFPDPRPRPRLELDPAELPAARLGVPYEARITVSGNVTPVYMVLVAEGNLPDGLNLEYVEHDVFATITGTPTRAGTFSFTISARCLGTSVSGQVGEMKYVLEVK